MFRNIKHMLLLPALATLVGCSSTADLGRSRIDAARLAYAPSATAQTDAAQLAISPEEEDMQARLHRFASLHDDNGWVGRIREIARRSSSPTLNERDYFDWLLAEYGSSPPAMYSRLSNDVQLDTALLPALFGSICDVQRVDDARRIAADRLPSTPPETQTALAERRQANADQITRFAVALEFRYNSYSYALEQLLVHAPSQAARSVDANLSDMSQLVARADNGSYCTSVAPTPRIGQQAVSVTATSSQPLDVSG